MPTPLLVLQDKPRFQTFPGSGNPGPWAYGLKFLVHEIRFLPGGVLGSPGQGVAGTRRLRVPAGLRVPARGCGYPRLQAFPFVSLVKSFVQRLSGFSRYPESCGYPWGCAAACGYPQGCGYPQVSGYPSGCVHPRGCGYPQVCGYPRSCGYPRQVPAGLRVPARAALRVPAKGAPTGLPAPTACVQVSAGLRAGTREAAGTPKLRVPAGLCVYPRGCVQVPAGLQVPVGLRVGLRYSFLYYGTL